VALDIFVRSRISVNPEADRNGQCRQDLTQCLSDILCEAIAARNDGKTSGSAIPKGLCPPARRADSRKRSRRRQSTLISVNSRKCADCRQRLQILNPPWDHYPWRSSVLTVSYSQPTIGQVMNISCQTAEMISDPSPMNEAASISPKSTRSTNRLTSGGGKSWMNFLPVVGIITAAVAARAWLLFGTH